MRAHQRKRRNENGYVMALVIYIVCFSVGMYTGSMISESVHEEDVVQNMMAPTRPRSDSGRQLTADDAYLQASTTTKTKPTSSSVVDSQEATMSTATSKAAIKAPTAHLPTTTTYTSTAAAQQLPFDDLPTSDPKTSTQIPKHYRTTKSIAACLYIMDDTIRLTEWLAYHYTVLPLSHLMVAIDPRSQQSDAIMDILNSWNDRMDIEALRNDTEWLDLPWDYGYSRAVRGRNGKLMKWYREKTSDIYHSQVHKRRQNYFTVKCMRSMKEKGMDWTMVTDSDEYLMFNYRHPKEEDYTLYDSMKRGVVEKDIDRERKRWQPYRNRLPSMETRVTVADYIHNEKIPLKCIMFPGLQFTSYESKTNDLFKNIPDGVNPNHLTTLRYVKAGRREGEFSKTMVDVSNGVLDDYTMETNVNVHVPNKVLCGMNGQTGSRQDYISSLFRLHHYRTGSWESFIERAADRRANMTEERFMERNIEPKIIDDDIRPWIGWFVEKVGIDEARRLLIQPLASAYERFNDVSTERRLLR